MCETCLLHQVESSARVQSQTRSAARRVICPTCEETIGAAILTVPAAMPVEEAMAITFSMAISCTEVTPGKFTHSDIEVDKVSNPKVISIHYVDSWIDGGN